MPAWDAFRDMDSLRREIDRAFSQFTSSRTPFARVAFLPGRAARAYPLINLAEDGDNLYVQALAPGVAPESLDLSVHHNTLTIAGEKLGMAEVPADACHRTERAAGRFRRGVELPVEVDGDRVQARYVDGLLTVTLPKAAAARPRQIQVDVT